MFPVTSIKVLREAVLEELLEKKKEPLEMLVILRAADKFAKGKAPKGVRVTRSQSTIYFTAPKKQKEDILDLKVVVGKYLKQHYKDRKFQHEKSRGKKIWWTYVGGRAEDLRVGIKVVLTDEEKRSIILGPIKGVNTG